MGVVIAYRQTLPLWTMITILPAGSCAVSPQPIRQAKAEIPPVLQVVTAVMQYDLEQIHGNLKDYFINEELESTMPWWTEVDPASLEADFPPEPKWIVPQELWCELPFRVRSHSAMQQDLAAREAEVSEGSVFRRVPPPALGLYAFSRPSFSRDGNLAIVYWTFYPPVVPLLGDVGFSRLARIQSEWTVVEWSKESIADFMSRPCVKQL